MPKPSRQTKTPSLQLAEDLHKNHTTAELAYKENPKTIVYTEEVVLKILSKHGLPPPDFEQYAKIAKDTPKGYMNRKKELLHLVDIIEKGMKKKGLNNTKLAQEMNINKSGVTRILSGENMTAGTMLKLERILDIKLLNH